MIKHKLVKNIIKTTIITAPLVLLVGCGGGGGSTPTPTPPGDTSIYEMKVTAADTATKTYCHTDPSKCDLSDNISNLDDKTVTMPMDFQTAAPDFKTVNITGLHTKPVFVSSGNTSVTSDGCANNVCNITFKYSETPPPPPPQVSVYEFKVTPANDATKAYCSKNKCDLSANVSNVASGSAGKLLVTFATTPQDLANVQITGKDTVPNFINIGGTTIPVHSCANMVCNITYLNEGPDGQSDIYITDVDAPTTAK